MRRLGPGVKLATFIMLNPSTAEAENDDATIRVWLRGGQSQERRVDEGRRLHASTSLLFHGDEL